jgi:peptidoglycan/xylan/chitin deacetylase (PgdA/CDA1 family)
VAAPPRDLVGYGPCPPSVGWPGGARVAVSLVVNYEEGSERTMPGDGENETLGEVTRSVAGFRDLATESVYEYGSRAGIHRLLRLFDRHDVKCTFFAAAVALEHNPDVCAWLREAGHEPCSHGWRWAEEWLLSREEEAERIRRAVASIERTCGERPVGWYSRWMPSEHTRELLVEEGGFLYDSNAYNDDLPYYVEVGGRHHLVVPYTLTTNDLRFVNGTLGGPGDFFDYCRRALDYLWDEGEDCPRMMSIGLHPRWSGQPARASSLAEFIEYARAKGDVWFARRRDIAEWWLDRSPPEGAAAGRTP